MSLTIRQFPISVPGLESFRCHFRCLVLKLSVPGLEISVYDAAARPVSAVAQQWKGFRMQDRFDGKIDIEIRPMEMMG